MRTVSKDYNDEHRYDDLIDYDWKGSRVRRHMSLSERAAQFAPFAALTGFDEKISETARLTDSKAELSEEEIAAIDEALRMLISEEGRSLNVFIEYFEEDDRKEGGRIRTYTGKIRKVDQLRQKVIFDKFSVFYQDILQLKIDA